MSPATRTFIEALIRLGKGILAETEKWLKTDERSAGVFLIELTPLDASFKTIAAHGSHCHYDGLKLTVHGPNGTTEYAVSQGTRYALSVK